MYLKIIFFVFFAIFGIQAFEASNFDVVKSISEEINRKQVIIVKTISEDTNYNGLLSLLKYFSNFGIYTLFQSPKRMSSSLMELVSYGYPTHKYIPRSIAVINNEDLPEMAELYFNENYDAVTSKISWILFTNSTEKIMEKLNRFYIPYHCQFLIADSFGNNNYNINEIYKIYPAHSFFRVTHFGIWDKTNDLIVPIKDFYARRINFNGSVFGIETTCTKLHGMWVCPDGVLKIFDELITSAANRLNFRYRYLFVNDSISYYNFSKYHPDSQIGFYLIGLYFFDSIVYNSNFMPIWNTRAYLHVRFFKEYEKGMSSPFIRPFTKSLWYSIGAWILASTTILLIINYNIKKYQKSLWNFDQFLDAFFMSFESFTNQCGSGSLPETNSYRIAAFLILIPPLFLVLAYSGIVISFITVRIIKFPFLNLEEFIEDGTFTIGHIKETFIKIWFKNTKDPVARLAYEKFGIKDEELIDVPDGVNKMCADPKFSFVHFDDSLFEDTYDCQPLQIPMPLFTTNIALAMRRFSTFKNIFTKMINLMRSSGTITANKKHIYYIDPTTGLLTKNTKDFLKTRSFEIDTVDWDAVESIFIFLAIAYLISAVILILERYIFQKFPEKLIFKKSGQKYFKQKTKAEFEPKIFNLRFSNQELKIEDID